MTLFAMIEYSIDLMPHKFHILPTGEQIIECIFPTATKWKDLQHRINEVMFPLYFTKFASWFIPLILPLLLYFA